MSYNVDDYSVVEIDARVRNLSIVSSIRSIELNAGVGMQLDECMTVSPRRGGRNMDMTAANVGMATEGDRLNKEGVLRDFVRFSWRATRGLGSATEADGRELVSQMVKVGRVTPEEGERLLTTLTARLLRSRQVFEERVDASVRRAVEKLAAISSREISRFGTQVEEIEKRMERLKSKRLGN